jgi:hypothetical protein
MKRIALAVLIALAAPALAVVPSAVSHVDATADGIATAYTFTFPVTTSASHVEVLVNGVAPLIAYTVTLNANQTSAPGGTVTFALPPAAAAVVRIQRTVPMTQETVYTPYSAFPAKTTEKAFDRVVYQAQQLDRRLSEAEATLAVGAVGGSSTVVTATGGGPTRSLAEWTANGPVTTTARTLAARASDAVWLQDFLPAGYVTDGTVDYATQIASAITAAQTGKKTLRLPAGTFKTTVTLTFANINVQGEGPESTGIDCYGVGACVTFSTNKGHRLSGLTLTSKAAGQTGLLVTATHPIVEALQIKEFDTNGLQVGVSGVSGTYYGQFSNIFVMNNTTQGVAGLYVAGPPAPSSNENTFTNVSVKGRWTNLRAIYGTTNLFIGGDDEPDTRGTGVSNVWLIDGYQNTVLTGYVELVSGSAYPTKLVTFTANSFANRILEGVYLAQNAYTTAHVSDLGWNNEFNPVPVGFNWPTWMRNRGIENLLPNANFSAWATATEPYGWVAFSGTPALDSSTKRGTSNSLKITAADVNFNVSGYIYGASGGNKSLNQVAIEYLRGRQVTCGAWVKSAFAGIGNVRVTSDGTGGNAWGATHHTGSGSWEFIAATGLVPADANNVGIAFRASNGGGNLTGDVWYSEPICVVGTALPHYAPRPIADTGGHLMGGLAFAPPVTYSVTQNQTVTLAPLAANLYAITVPAGVTAFYVNPPAAANARVGQFVTVIVKNASGGAITTNWNVAFKKTWTEPANGFSRAASYVFDGTVWTEVSRTPADVPN